MPGLLSMEQQPSDLASAIQHDTIKSEYEGQRTNGASVGAFKSVAPPPLDDSWRNSTANVSLGKLLERLAEGCFADFSELVAKLGNTPLESVNGHINGVHPPGGVDTDSVSLKKKTELLNFAKEWRERFIKARIISDWARSSGEDVARTIDLRNTLATRLSHVHSTLIEVFRLKQQTPHLRMPQPNIKGAMQYLSTGKSSYPELDFILPPPLTARQVLDMTHEMEVAANLRIWLNEPKAPWHMSDYRLENGRVAWICPGEFEVDLAVVDQLPEKSPWYFVELRPLFRPTPTIPAEARVFLENHINAAAAANSIQGVYDFCHNYILDYRITEIETQAIALLKGRFFGTLRVQRLRRNLTVQYWTTRGGKKSWLEFGVHSGNGFNSSHEPVTPVNNLRWFKEGKLVEDTRLDFDWSNLDLEALLLDVPAKHALPLLETISADLKTQKMTSRMLSCEICVDHGDASKTALVLRMPSAHPACQKEVRVSIAPQTGHWVISPTHPKLDELQANVTKNPSVFTADVVELFLSDMMQDGVEFEGRLRSWRRLFTLPPNSRSLKAMFDGAVQVSVWQLPDKFGEWPEAWAVAYSTSLDSARWWLVQTIPGRAAVIEAYRLEVTNQGLSKQITEVERIALAEAQLIGLRLHNTNDVSFHVAAGANLGRAAKTARETNYYLFANELLKTHQWPKNETPFWSRGLMRIASLTSTTQSRRQDMRLSVLPGRLTHLRRYLVDHSIKGVVVNSTHGLAVSFDYKPGMDLWTSACIALLKVAKLDRALAAVYTLGLEMSSIGLDHISFTYGKQELSAQIVAKSNTTELHLLPVSTNPQQRVRASLEHLLQANNTKAYESMMHILLFTLPALDALSKLDTTKAGAPVCSIHTRNISWYSIKYSGEPSISFTLRVRERFESNRRTIRWHLSTDRPKPAAAPLPENMSNALQDLWTNPGQGCESLKNGLAANSASIAFAIEKLHAIVALHVKPMARSEQHELTKDEGNDGKPVAATSNDAKIANGDIIMLD